MHEYIWDNEFYFDELTANDIKYRAIKINASCN